MGLLRTSWSGASQGSQTSSSRTVKNGQGVGDGSRASAAIDALRNEEEEVQGRDSGPEGAGHRRDSRFVSSDSTGGDIETSFLKTICKIAASPLILSSLD